MYLLRKAKSYRTTRSIATSFYRPTALLFYFSYDSIVPRTSAQLGIPLSDLKQLRGLLFLL